MKSWNVRDQTKKQIVSKTKKNMEEQTNGTDFH